jgi:hypothetical protein
MKGEGTYAADSFLELVVVSVILERFLARQELPEHNAKRIDVRLLIELLELHHLRRHPNESTHNDIQENKK